jgi:sulfur-oxidizing protein SoxY
MSRIRNSIGTRTGAGAHASTSAATRRALLRAASALPLLALARPASATPEEMRAAISRWTGGKTPNEGKVTFDIAKLIDNGNAVPVTIRVDSPMTPQDHVTGIALFNERNPETDIARFTLTSRSGKAEVSTRIRLATSQKLVAVARMSDGGYWQQTVDVIVALAACIEGEPM